VRRPLALAVSLSLVATSVLATAPVIAQADCDPFQTVPDYGGTVPTAEEQLGFAFGEQQVDVAEVNEYLAAVDAASDRVVTANAATSVGGLAINYAIVGTPDRVTPAGLTAIRANLAVLRDPNATGQPVADAIAGTPAILWVSGNVHGGEESGTDASLHALFELADRDDCVVDEILANAIVVILPTQNPDGREIGQRRNLYGFDMNRDWFARTQPETDGKLEVVRQYPPMLYIDAHEFGLSNYFFPPNADPEYHEIPDTAHDWINQLYSPAIASEFDRQGIKYFHGAPYDFFAIVFGDTVPTEGFHAAGMTFEKESGDPISEREHEQFVSIWASVFAGAAARSDVVSGWRASWVEAYQQGVAGQLEPNAVFEPRHDLYQEVPDVTVRHYFLRDDPARAHELQLLVRRLQRMDVEVYELTAPYALSDFHPYGDPVTEATLPVGTYWIPLAQAQKHWVQAMLHEESWIPFDVTYDVTAWSNPLLMNLDGGWTGNPNTPSGALVAPLAAPEWTLPAELPSIGLLENVRSTRGFESAGQTRWLFERAWGLENGADYVDVTPADVVAGLPGIDVLVIPDGYPGYLVQDLGAKGKRALREWVNGGGRIVAWQGGAVVAAKAGASTVKFGNSQTNAPGTLIRVSVDDGSPLAAGVGARNWVMYLDDPRMQPGLGTSVADFPAFGDPDYATSGLTIGVDSLAGSTAVADEAVGAGRVVSFSIDPNFRAWSQGTQRMLWNAIVGPDPAGFGAPAAAGSRERAAAEKAAADAAAGLLEFGSAIRIRVAVEDAATTAKVLKRHGAEVARFDLVDGVLFVVANRKDLSYDEHPFFTLVVRDLEAAGIAVQAASLP
jgi:hypothetical protein